MSDFLRRLERMQFDQQNMLRARRGEKTLPIPERLLDESERPKMREEKEISRDLIRRLREAAKKALKILDVLDAIEELKSSHSQQSGEQKNG